MKTDDKNGHRPTAELEADSMKGFGARVVCFAEFVRNRAPCGAAQSCWTTTGGRRAGGRQDAASATSSKSISNNARARGVRFLAFG